MNCIAEEAPNAGMLMFVDEDAKNECTLLHRYGHSGKGVHCIVQKQFIRRGLWYSIIHVIILDGICI